VLDNNPKMMTEIMYEAAKHDGTSVVEILQNCVIFNDNAHAIVSDKESRDDNTIILKHGEPMLFGKNNEKGIRLNNTRLEVVEIGKNGISEKDILVHDAYIENPGLQLMLAEMAPPHLTVALGVIRAIKKPTYDDLVVEQIESNKASSKIKCVDDLLNSGTIFEVN
jgi:2-oxoglutarate ferredoxin oxidoreductase subunit beta